MKIRFERENPLFKSGEITMKKSIFGPQLTNLRNQLVHLHAQFSNSQILYSVMRKGFYTEIMFYTELYEGHR